MGYDAVALSKHPEVTRSKNGRIEHVHTAGNSSGIVDGAALVLVGSLEKGRALGLQPRARIVSMGLVGTEPTIMLTGPGPASKAALKAAGMSAADVDLFEVNEAFAAVVLRFMRDMQIDSLDKINVNGGAIALGHPLGATGAMLLGTALDELERRDKETALITLCVGFGMGIATIIERGIDVSPYGTQIELMQLIDMILHSNRGISPISSICVLFQFRGQRSPGVKLGLA